MVIIGIDDAGRGPVIGPMVLGGVMIEKITEEKLKELGVKDSKMLYPKQRTKMKKVIEEISKGSKAVIMTAKEINDYMDKNINLNTIEAIAAAQVINYLLKEKEEEVTIILDCPSVNTKAWLERVKEFMIRKENVKFICEHKADQNYVVVGAASIIAKVTRDEEIKKLREKIGKDFGSGYPNDPKTKEFLKEHYKEYQEEEIFRKHWSTITRLTEEKTGIQKKLY
ncbi:ribonuclease HII [Candidatus Pacearchaeota archaeon CG10_big_fil_rev_8_21_14_0_10_35_13]|nr:MAG: ribonuclease HII [Candidatus Pacearchaeota archaeon CG10_big_fil_rev_8_21_14_0_10_35_13]